MKDNVLQTMISDPEFDPMKWLGLALKFYVDSRPREVMSDPVTCKYILNAMEEPDWGRIASALPPTEVAVTTFINKVNASSETGRNRNDAERRLQTKLTHDDYVHLSPHLLSLKGFSRYPDKIILDSYNGSQILKAVFLWNNKKWDFVIWRQVVHNLDGERLFEMVQEPTFPKRLVKDLGPRGTYESTSDKVKRERQAVWTQSILAFIIRKMPGHHLCVMSGVLDKFTPDILDKMYQDSYKEKRGNVRERLKDNRIYRDVRFDDGWYTEYETKKYDPRFNDLMCRCGYMAANSSAYRNHHKKCSMKGYLPLSLLLRLEYARRGGSSMICSNCGKKCKTNSGMTLHRKRCNKRVESKDGTYLSTESGGN